MGMCRPLGEDVKGVDPWCIYLVNLASITGCLCGI